jgi:hypothetical protein
MLLLIAALATANPPAPSWLAGYWLMCEPGREVSETWSAPRAGTMANTTLTLKGDQLTVEIADIAARDGTLVLHARPPGQAAADFRLKAATATSLVFENLAHDFPQRVSYRREGQVLHARIEGVVGGRMRAVDWTYRARPFNSRCP